MPKFRYRATDENHRKVTGFEKADSLGAVHVALIARGLEPVQVSLAKSWWQIELTAKKVPRKELMNFSRQLGVFIKAGVTIIEALEVIGSETTDKALKRIIDDMIGQLQAGQTFASAASAHPEAFPEYYLGILQSAELTGTLDTAMAQLAEYIERDQDARSTLVSAMIYPAVVMAMSIGTVLVLVLFVMPRFVTFFASFNATLPLPTRMLLSGSSFVSRYGVEIALVVVGSIVGFVLTRRTPSGRRRIDSVILRLPIVGDLVSFSVLERISRVLASLVNSGVALPEAMTVTADSANNMVFRQALGSIRESMMQGEGLAGPLARTGLFPGAAQQMFRIGEETGTLGEQLETAATFYRRELDVQVKRFTSLFEPAIIIFMGVVVGFVAVALVSAMYGIYRQVNVG